MMNKKMITLAAMLFAAATLKAQDWPNLTKYHDANTKVAPPKKGENRVVYMGDSITDGWPLVDSAFFSGKPYYGRGIGGQTTGQMLLRFRQDVIALKPKVVVLLAGINDIAENNGPERMEDIFGNIASMAELAKANHIKVVLSSVLPAATLPWRPAINPVPKVKELNILLKNYAEQNKLGYIDYFTAMVDANNGLPANLSGDGIHPNLGGYKVMEPLAEAAVKAALLKKDQ